MNPSPTMLGRSHMDEFGSQKNASSRGLMSFLRYPLAAVVVLIGAFPTWVYVNDSLSDKQLAKYALGWLVPLFFTGFLAMAQMIFSSWLISGGMKGTDGGEWFAVAAVLALTAANVLAGFKGTTGFSSGEGATVLVAAVTIFIATYWLILEHFFKLKLVTVWW